MTDLVVGGGAVGTLVAWALASGGRDVAIVRRRLDSGSREGRVAATDPDGARSEAPVTEVRSPADLETEPAVIVLAVKMFDLAAAVDSCAAWPPAPVLTVSNGIGAEELVAGARSGRILAGSITTSVELAGPGEVVRLNRGGIALAPYRGDVESLADELVEAFGKAGLRSMRQPDAPAMKWSKLVANLVANATSAILDLPAGEIYADPAGYRIERRQLLEAFAVIRRLGLEPVALPGVDVRLLRVGLRLPDAVARPVIAGVVGGARGGKDPSLRLHAASGDGRSEVEWLNGAVASAAERLGGRAPVNRALGDLVAEVLADEIRRAWFRRRPDRLLEALPPIA